MNPLKLSPLPSVRANDDTSSLGMERQGFVDEEAILALMSAPTHLRSTVYPEDLALAADDLDFAGWQLPRTAPIRTPEIPPKVIDAIVRRATPPGLRHPDRTAPHLGYRRGWLAGLAGAISTLIFSLLLVTLSSQTGAPKGGTSITSPPQETESGPSRGGTPDASKPPL